MIRLLPFALVFFGLSNVVAQPSLSVSTDMIQYPVETTFAAANIGVDSLILSFPTTNNGLYGTTVGYGWSFEVETPDSLYEYIYLPFVIDELPMIPLGPGDQASFRITEFDPCPACVTGGDFTADTLYLQAIANTETDDAQVILDLSKFVSAEPAAPLASLQLSTYPNPARHALTVDLTTEPTAALNLIITDMLGRVVWESTMPASAQTLLLHLNDFSAGVYLLQVQTESADRIMAKQFVVIR